MRLLFASTMAAALLCASISQTSAEQIRLAAWNLANLASGPGVELRGYKRSKDDYEAIKAQIREMDVDIIALQEIGSIPGAQEILGDNFVILFETRCYVNESSCKADNNDIYNAIAYRKHLASNVQTFQIDELAINHTSECGDSRPVRGGVGVKMEIGGQTTWIASVHMKAGCKDDRIEVGTEDDCETQRAQYEKLAEWIAARPQGDAVILAGDMNRLLLNKNDSIRNEIFLSTDPKTKFFPEFEKRGCWKAYRFNFDQLKDEARKNNPIFNLQNITPQIYTPLSNIAIDFFVVINLGGQASLISDQIELDNLYRFESPGETLTACDGSVVTFGDGRALTFGKSYPSDHCPILMTIDY